MARTVNATAYAERRNAILDVAQHLVMAKGYEQMSIQDVLDTLHMSKGGFFHYFPSKHALLEGIIDRLQEQVLSVLRPIAEAESASSLIKLQRFFAALVAWKTARRPFFVQMLRVWYADENAIVRDKVRAAALAQLTPLLATIVHEGVREGVFTSDYPDEIAQAILTLIWALSDTLARRLVTYAPLSGEARQPVDGKDWRIPLSDLERTVAAYSDAVERMLGALTHSLRLVDRDTLQDWFHSSHGVSTPAIDGAASVDLAR